MKHTPLVCFLLLGLTLEARCEPYFIATSGSAAPSKTGYAGDSAFRVGLGYRFLSALSFETSYVDLGTSAVDTFFDREQTAGEISAILGQQFPGIAVQADSATGEIAINGVAAALQAESRVMRAFGIYGRIGAFSWVCDQRHTLALRINNQPVQETSVSSTYRGIDLIVGIGANFRLSQHWGLTVEATNYATSNLDSHYLGGGMKYYF